MAGHYAGLSIAYRNTVLDGLPALYLHLDTTEAGVDDTGFVECSGTSYNCPAVTLGAAAAGSRSNSAVIDTAAAGAGGWGTPVAFRLTTSATPGEGTLVARGPIPLANQKEIAAGDFYRIAIGDLDIALTATET